MNHNSSTTTQSSEVIEDMLGRQIERIRLSRNITQSALAAEAGVSRSTISRLSKPNAGISLDSFIRILKALHLEDNLTSLIPDPDIRPLQRLESGKQTRKRARQTTKEAPDDQQSNWAWRSNEDNE